MNHSIIRFVIGKILMIEAGLMVLPLICSMIYREWSVAVVFLITIGIALGLGFLLSFKKAASSVFYAKEGYVATALSWIDLRAYAPTCAELNQKIKAHHLVINEGNVRIIAAEQPASNTVDKVIDLVPNVVDKVSTMMGKKKSEEPEIVADNA